MPAVYVSRLSSNNPPPFAPRGPMLKLDSCPMPDPRTHRGPHPEDAALFDRATWPSLQAAVGDYSWLLSRGYAEPSAIKIVGDRYALDKRQRMAVVRSSCTDAAREVRQSKQLSPDRIAGKPLWIDGFNVLTTLEVALSGGVVLAGRDACYRDIAGMHGTYRKVEETRPAILHAGECIARLRPAETAWFLDSPVGNSGRLKLQLLDIAAERGWNWSVNVVPNPDAVLIEAEAVVATADSIILDRCQRWFNLARIVIDALPNVAYCVPIGDQSAER